MNELETAKAIRLISILIGADIGLDLLALLVQAL